MPSERPTPARPKPGTNFALVFGVMGCIAAFLLVALRLFVIEAFKIPSGAMQPTLMVGDHIMVNKLFAGRQPKRGELIVFKFPEHPEQDFVKRVIAIRGDTLEVRSGHPWLNGWEVPHCVVGKAKMPSSEGGTLSGELDLEFLEGAAYPVFFDEATAGYPEYQGPFEALTREAWVLGDNRNNSHDSRMWFGGHGAGVPMDLVIGRPLFRWLSVTAEDGIDGSRFGKGFEQPLLPASMKSLEGAMKKCLDQRPPLEKTVPPPR